MATPEPNPNPNPNNTTTPPGPGPYTPLLNLAPDPFVRPLSPWALRYGHVRDEFLHPLDEFRHSTFAPEYPRLDARYWADDPGQLSHFHGFTRGLHEDRLFYSEVTQQTVLKMFTFQNGPLNRYVAFGPRFPKILGGHSRVRDHKDDPRSVIADAQRLTGVTYATNDEALMAVFHLERIKVDESKWFRFFRKSRWWDPDPNEDHTLGLRWSIDDAKVWAQFGIILELANRIVNALIVDQHDWMRTVLFGRLDYWKNVRADQPYDGARVLLSRDADRLACKAKGRKSFFDSVKELPDWRFRLETLLSGARWTFKDDPDSHSMGVTDPVESGLISIDVRFLRLLCRDDITLSERCLIMIVVTTTVLHELMHHVNLTRVLSGRKDINNYLNIGKDPEEQKYWEPFVDYDGEAEIGHAFEKGVFGGTIEESPWGLPITVLFASWPGYRGKATLNLKHPSFSPDHLLKTWRVPSTWASMLLASSFWDDPTNLRKSDRGFHLAPLFVSYTANEPPAPRTYGPVTVDRNMGYATSLDEGLVKEWDERMNLWVDFRRGWYDDALSRWWTTPWGETGLRTGLNTFARLFKDHDEVGCAVEANRLVNTLPWDDANDAMIIQRLPPYDHASWVYSAIGLFMMAACPNRTGFLTKPSSEYIMLNGGPIKPSAMAQGINTNEVIQRRTLRSTTDEIVVAPPSIRNPFRSIPSGTPVAQFDYLGLASNLLEYLGQAGSTVYGPWLFEIIRCGNLLQEERTRLRNQYPNDHESRWAYDWEFQMPEYVSSNLGGRPQPALWVRWDPTINGWAGVPPPPPSPSGPSGGGLPGNVSVS